MTIRGRLWSNSFEYPIYNHNHTVNVSSVQIEVDAGYESPKRIYIIEAKKGKRDNFHIRQLYYPYRDWSGKTTKEVVPIFFTYTNGLFYLTQFKFGDSFSDISIVKNECYTINEHPTQSVDLVQLLRAIIVEKEPIDIPYPQADDLDKVIDLVSNVKAGYDNKFDIASYFEFDERQGDYYANAAIYLGLIKRTKRTKGKIGIFELTDLGLKLLNCDSRVQRNLVVLKQLLKKPTFNESIVSLSKNKLDVESLSKNQIAMSIEMHTELTKDTPLRRTSTVLSWLRWICKNMDLQIPTRDL